MALPGWRVMSDVLGFAIIVVDIAERVEDMYEVARVGSRLSGALARLGSGVIGGSPSRTPYSILGYYYLVLLIEHK